LSQFVCVYHFATMQKTLDLPTELWFKIIEASELGARDLKVISLTSKRFRALSTSRLFRCLHLWTNRGTRGRLETLQWIFSREGLREHRTPSTIDQFLEFYGSEMIAPLVQEFCLDRYSYDSLIQPSIETILALLRRLPRLERITFRSSNFDARVMHELGQLPTLSSVSIRDCTAPATDIPHLRLKKVELLDPGPWPFTVDPDLLESLSIVDGGFPAASCLPNLRTFSIYGYPVAPVVRCLDFLVHCPCPSLETLTFYQVRNADGSPADINQLPTIPFLKTYRGPIRFAPLFATAGSLLRVQLWGSTRSRGSVVRRLRELRSLAPNIISLTTDVCVVEESVLRAALSFLHLEELVLVSQSRDKISAKACIHSPHSHFTS
jgi:hypothetical protein